MHFWKVTLLEMRRKRREFNAKSLRIIVPLLVLFIALFAFLIVTQYQDVTPTYSLITDSELLSLYTQNSLFANQSDAELGATLRVSDGLILQVVDERTFAQRASLTALRSLLRSVNKQFMEQNQIQPPVLLNISTRFREEIVERSFDQISPQNQPSSGPDIDSVLDQPAETVSSSSQEPVVVDILAESPVPSEELVLVQDITAQPLEPLVQEGSVEGYDTVEDLDTLQHITHVFVAIELLVVLNFFSVLFASSLFQEKIKMQSALLFVSPISALSILVGKMIPYAAVALVIIMGILLANGISAIHLFSGVLVSLVLLLLYFSVAYFSAVFSRSHKEFSFVSVFSISFISLYLIIPAFIANYSLISNASLLTPLVLFAQGQEVSSVVLFFLLVVYLLVALWIFYLGSRLFTFEEFYSLKGMFSKITRMTELFVDKWWKAALYSFMVIPIAWLIEVVLIVLWLVAQVGGVLVFIVISAALVEELLRNLAIFGWMREQKHNLKSAAIISLATGVGFGIAEKSLLFIMVAPFIEGYEYLVAGSIFVPVILHGGLTFLFYLLYRYAKFPFKSYFTTCVLLAIAHAAINLTIIGVFT